MNYDTARTLVIQATGLESEGEWTLTEFSGGWLVVRDHAVRDTLGAVSIVVEAATGQVLSLPSSVPPRLIIEQWDRARKRAKLVSPSLPK